NAGYAIFRSYNSYEFYINYKTSGVWSGWKQLGTPNDTGWLPITIKNGYNKSTLPDYEPSYRVIDYDSHKKVYDRLAVTKLTSGKKTIASIPKEFNPYKIYSVGVSTIAKIPPKVVIACGDIEFHPNNNDDYITTDYIIYQDEWIIYGDNTMKISINRTEREGNEEDVLKLNNHIFSKENKKQPTFADR